MTHDLDTLLAQVAGTPPPPPSAAELAAAGDRRRRRATARTAVVAVAAVAVGAVAVTGLAPGLRPSIGPDDVASTGTPAEAPPTTPAGSAQSSPPDGPRPGPGVAVASDGEVPTLTADAAPVAVQAQVLPGMAGPFSLAAVATDGRVTTAGIGSGALRTGAPGAQPVELTRPAAAALCTTMAYDTAGTLWALCTDGEPPADEGRTLLAYAPGATDPVVHEVDALLGAVARVSGQALLAVAGRDVRAVVSTGDPLDGRAATVQLVRGGQVLTAAEATDTVAPLPQPRIDELDGSVGASAGVRVQRSSPVPSDPGEVRVDWLGATTTVALTHPRGLFPTVEGSYGPTAFVDGRVAVTIEALDADQAAAWGIVADPDGSTAVVRLPTSSQPQADPAAAPLPPAAVVALAPDGTTHLVALDAADELTVAPLLDADLRPVPAG